MADRSPKEIVEALDPMVRVAAYHLINVWGAYGRGSWTELPHLCMSAGEHATDWLAALGLAEDIGWEAKLTPAGQYLIDNADPNDESDPLVGQAFCAMTGNAR